ncbi:hypothetical protein [Nostoc sp. FACHB-145]|uniref:hypothetical protein n=1 Tax=Nostoc sp. FACHB-145 TaxID=2692836 RepID=UPI0016869769|nr:hypothetical protein [Nostoc sp. FACHB-145]MBD2468799.1 hypothetical protein [Nostoc sp. FACHB-145]
MINICQKILCPYFGEKGHNYGCQRYSRSGECHLQSITQIQENEYALYTNDEAILTSLKIENDRFFLEDTKYAEDLEFQQEYPECFNERSFKVKEIQRIQQ